MLYAQENMTATPTSPFPRQRTLFAALALLLLLAGPATAQAPSTSLDTTLENALPGGDARWDLTADRVQADHEARVLEAWGDVRMTQDDNSLTADHARYYEATGWVFLQGNVVVDWGPDHLEAETAEFDLKNKTGWLTHGQIFVAEPHLYFKGDYIEKHVGDTYSFTNATVTACDGDTPAWSLASAEGEVTLDGYATLWHSRLNVRDTPVIYTPWMLLPVKRSRQSGLLVPETGFSSRLGFNVNQPFYWAIDEESDLTVYENYMARRGFMHGVEYRRTPDPDTQDLARFDFLLDNVKDKTERDEDEQFRGDRLTRPNRTRYWWRSKHDGYLADPRWKTKLDIDWVSDQNYLREFKDGKSGYTTSRETFLERFRRDIASRDDTERTSALLVQRSYDTIGVAAKTEITQNLKYMNGNREESKNPSLQRLPELSAYVYKDYLLATPLEFQMETQAGNYWRREGTRGSRLDLRPRVSAPLSLGAVSIIPTAGLRATGYAVESYNGTAEDHDDNLTARQIADFSVSAFTEMSKVYSLSDAPGALAANAGTSAWTRVRHAVQPRVDWDWTDSVDQSKKPYYDADDRVPAVNELTYSLTNILDRRRDTVSLEPGRDGGPDRAVVGVDYLDFLRLRLAHGFDLREAQRTDMRDEYPRRPFNDAMAELTVNPQRWVGVTSRTFYSPYLSSITEHDHSLWVGPDKRNRAEFGLEFRESLDEYKRRARERIRLMRLGLDLVVSRRWSTGITYRADMESGEDLEKTLEARYSHQCFDAVFVVTQTPFEERFEIRLELLGISF